MDGHCWLCGHDDYGLRRRGGNRYADHGADHGEGLADAANAGKTDEEAPENGSTVKVTKEGIELNSPRVTLATAVVKQPEE